LGGFNSQRRLRGLSTHNVFAGMCLLTAGGDNGGIADGTRSHCSAEEGPRGAGTHGTTPLVANERCSAVAPV
jgi:hypothetical protein